MRLRAAHGYDVGAIAFHWITVVLLVPVGVLGLLHDSWPKRTHVFWINVHAILGLVLWLILISRFWWRVQHAPPALPADLGALSRRFSTPVHLGLYALMFITPMVGVVTFIWHGRIFDFGLFQLDLGIRPNHAVFGPTEDVHGYLAYALFGLVGLHVLAAMWHRFILRDAVMQRMWPRREDSGAALELNNNGSVSRHAEKTQ